MYAKNIHTKNVLCATALRPAINCLFLWTFVLSHSGLLFRTPKMNNYLGLIALLCAATHVAYGQLVGEYSTDMHNSKFLLNHFVWIVVDFKQGSSVCIVKMEHVLLRQSTTELGIAFTDPTRTIRNFCMWVISCFFFFSHCEDEKELAIGFTQHSEAMFQLRTHLKQDDNNLQRTNETTTGAQDLGHFQKLGTWTKCSFCLLKLWLDRFDLRTNS